MRRWVILLATIPILAGIGGFPDKAEFYFLRMEYTDAPFVRRPWGRGWWMQDMPEAEMHFTSGIERLTRIHIGELDDWTPADTCVDLGAALTARREDFVVTTYADSYHAFDSPTGKVVHRTDVPNGIHPGQGVHVGPNPAARAAANARVRAFLRERLARLTPTIPRKPAQ